MLILKSDWGKKYKFSCSYVPKNKQSAHKDDFERGRNRIGSQLSNKNKENEIIHKLEAAKTLKAS